MGETEHRLTSGKLWRWERHPGTVGRHSYYPASTVTWHQCCHNVTDGSRWVCGTLRILFTPEWSPLRVKQHTNDLLRISMPPCCNVLTTPVCRESSFLSRSFSQVSGCSKHQIRKLGLCLLNISIHYHNDRLKSSSYVNVCWTSKLAKSNIQWQ